LPLSSLNVLPLSSLSSFQERSTLRSSTAHTTPSGTGHSCCVITQTHAYACGCGRIGILKLLPHRE
jgi:hypothetical protein